MKTMDNPSGFWIRVGAALIDSLILTPILIAITMVMSFATFGLAISNPESINMAAMAGQQFSGTLFVMLVTMAYYVFMESSKWQGTVGKMIFGVKVVGEEGGRISILRSIGRHFARMLSGIFYIGYIMVGVRRDKRGLHDLIAGTHVVRK